MGRHSLERQASRLRNWFTSRVGRCQRCMRLARNCAIVSWATLALLWALSATQLALIAGVVVAATVTTLSLVHGGVFAYRQLAGVRRVERQQRRYSDRQPMIPSRRAALGLL